MEILRQLARLFWTFVAEIGLALFWWAERHGALEITEDDLAAVERVMARRRRAG